MRNLTSTRTNSRCIGTNMWPFIRDSTIVRLSTDTQQLHVGDIVQIRKSKAAILHRIIRKRGVHYLLKGDGESTVDGWYDQKSIPGVLVGIYTKHAYIDACKISFRRMNAFAAGISRMTIGKPWLISSLQFICSIQLLRNVAKFIVSQ